MRHSLARAPRRAHTVTTGDRPFVDTRMAESASVDSDWDNWDYNPFAELETSAHEEAEIREAGHAW